MRAGAEPAQVVAAPVGTEPAPACVSAPSGGNPGTGPAAGSATGPGPDTSRPLVLACGPRARGNSDRAAELMAQGLAQAGAEPILMHLRDMRISPCLGCQRCSTSPGHGCVLQGADQAEALFGLIMAASLVVFSSPIYFYHLPAGFKGFIDRAQRFYAARLAGDAALTALPRRQALVCLVAGRPRGEKLFDGSLLTLRYFLWPFNVGLAEPLCLPGLDAPGDLRGAKDTEARTVAYAADAWRNTGR